MGAGEVPRLPAQAAEVEVRLRQARVQCNRTLEAPLRLAGMAEIMEDVAQVVVETGVFRREVQRATVRGERFPAASRPASKVSSAPVWPPV